MDRDRLADPVGRAAVEPDLRQGFVAGLQRPLQRVSNFFRGYFPATSCCARWNDTPSTVPMSLTVTPRPAMATYHGSMHVGLHADPAAPPDLDTLAQHFGTALGALLAC